MKPLFDSLCHILMRYPHLCSNFPVCHSLNIVATNHFPLVLFQQFACSSQKFFIQHKVHNIYTRIFHFIVILRIHIHCIRKSFTFPCFNITHKSILFSAGAHLAASTALLWDAAPVQQALGITGTEARPNAVVLGYPVITSGKFAHRGSFENLCGADEALLQTMSLENQVRPDVPPFFIWHTVEDQAVPVENSLLLAGALKENNVPFELHLFTHGGHGSSTCTNEVNTPNKHNNAWLPLCMGWLGETLDFTL